MLADALYALRQRNSEIRKMEHELEDELRRRIGERGTVLVFGDYEVTAKPEYRQEWDADGLEGTLRELLEQGVVEAGEVADVIRRETTVSGREMQRLFGRLGGNAHAAVEQCFRWVPKGPARVHVARPPEGINRSTSRRFDPDGDSPA